MNKLKKNSTIHKILNNPKNAQQLIFTDLFTFSHHTTTTTVLLIKNKSERKNYENNIQKTRPDKLT